MRLFSLLALLLLCVYPCLSSTPLPVPYVCTSKGDPHISPFTTSPYPLYTPGVQAAGYFLLASFGTTNVYADQQACGTPPNAYCNYKTAVENGGVTVVIEGDTVTVIGIFAFPITLSIPVGGSLPLAPYADITVSHTAYGAYTIEVPEGYVQVQPNGSPGYPGIQDITITDIFAPPPFGGLCGQLVASGDLLDFIEANHIPYLADNGPFGPESAEDYNAANPPSDQWIPFNVPQPDDKLLANILRVCAPLQTGAAVQVFGRFIDPKPYYDACYDDVAITKAVGFAAAQFDGYLFKGNKTLPDVPFVLPTSPISTTAFGPGLQAQVPLGETSFTIQSRDATGSPVQYRGPDQFKISSVSKGSTGQIQFAAPIDNQDGTYLVYYAARIAGVYNISISANNGDNEILGSPFTVTIGQ